MPVSHIGLTVSHLPTSCSFFLSALQPLGYRFIGQQGGQIGLGIEDADFFLCQETPGMKAGAAHIAFSAPSRIAVRDFYTAALNAGARPHGAPAMRNGDTGYFNAAVLDFDGNSIEVVFYENGNDVDAAIGDAASSVAGRSRVITWGRSVQESLPDDRSVVSSLSRASKSVATAASSVPSGIRRSAPSVTRSVSAPMALIPAPASRAAPQSDAGAKKLVGTLLGAAAGAAVAYAMVKGEADSAKEEAAFAAAVSRKEQSQAPASHHPIAPSEQERYAPPRFPYAVDERDSTGYRSTAYSPQRAIEPAPVSYQSPHYRSVAPSQMTYATQQPAIESTVSRSRKSATRSVSDSSTIRARGTAARSTLVGSFAPSETPRTKSTHLSDARASGSGRSGSKGRTKSHSPSEVPLPPSKPGSIMGSVLGRATADHSHANGGASADTGIHGPMIEEVREEGDNDTVAPSDSISNAGSPSRGSRHAHSKAKPRQTSQSKHSEHSSHSKSSKHGGHASSSRRSSARDADVVIPDSISEAGSTSTIKPVKHTKGSAASLPIRGSASCTAERKKREVVSYARG